jgi:hypothetical protein
VTNPRFFVCSALLTTLCFAACSDDGNDDGNAAGSGGTAGSSGSAGSSTAGSAGSTAGSAGSAGSSTAGSGGSSVAGSAGSTGEAGSNAGGSAGSANEATGCDGLCGRALDCDNEDFAECVDNCEDSAELCPDESDDVIECSLARPDSDFECDNNGVTALVAGVCSAESTAFQRCLFF